MTGKRPSYCLEVGITLEYNHDRFNTHGGQIYIMIVDITRLNIAGTVEVRALWCRGYEFPDAWPLTSHFLLDHYKLCM